MLQTVKHIIRKVVKRNDDDSNTFAPPAGQVNFGYQPSDTTDTLPPMPLYNGRKQSVMERGPNIEHYRISDAKKKHGLTTRPSLDELHQETSDKKRSADASADLEKAPADEAKGGAVKFGWIIGVLVRCVLNILGGMLYLRISWVGAQAGIGLGSIVILLSSFVTSLTAVSMCAICTNGEVKGGGAYYMLSRALGPEFGGSMGLISSIANACAVALHIISFAETCRDLMKERDAAIVDVPEAGTNDMRIIGVGVLIILMCIVLIGVDFEVKMQLVLLVVLSVSYINYIAGTFVPPSDFKRSRGITGYTWETFSTNFVPAWRGESFFSVFSVFFPAATGIMAGANISGDLKDASSAIPRGTLLAIFSTAVIYLGALWMVGSSAVRDASGVVEDLFNGSITACAQNGTNGCPYGIMNYMQTMELQSGLGPLITAGIFAASLSSALACLVSGPKIFQAVCRDNLFPKIDWFGVGFGKQDEPRRAYFLGFFISLGMVLVGELNMVAPYISNFYLATYALINYACFHGSLIKSPGWRPSFKYYNKWLSLLGSVLCVAAMFLMSWIAALCTIAFIVALYIYLVWKKPDVNWGSSNQAENYKTALQGMLKLLYTEEHVKNYRPQILALCGNPVARPMMVDFLKSITRQKGLMLLGHVIVRQPTPQYYKFLKKWGKEVQLWLRNRKSKAFYCPVAANSMREGLQALLQLSGLGKLAPNIVIMGFKHDWKVSSAEEIEDYFQLIHESFDCEVGVGVLKIGRGLDFSEQMLEHQVGDTRKLSMMLNSNNVNGPSAQIPFIHISSNDTPLSIVHEEEPNDYGSIQHDYGSTSLTPPISNVSETQISMVEEELDRDNILENSTNTLNSGSISSSSSSSISSEPHQFKQIQTIAERVMESLPTDRKLMHSSPSNVYSRQLSASIQMNYNIRRMSKVQKDIVAQINQFQGKVKNPTIHVYWLADDGGLTLLIPHLIANNKSFLYGAQLRIFTVAHSIPDAEEEKKSIETLLQKFRIQIAEVTMITDLHKVPNSSTISEFDRMIEPFKVKDGYIRNSMNQKICITDAELERQRDRTYRHLRTRELLLEHSKMASLVVITQPVPRKGGVSAPLYLAWLDFLSKDFSPMLFIRGNQQSVLTFYS